MTAFKSLLLLWELSHLLQRCFLAKRGLPRQLDVCILIDALKEDKKINSCLSSFCTNKTLITKSRFHITVKDAEHYIFSRMDLLAVYADEHAPEVISDIWRMEKSSCPSSLPVLLQWVAASPAWSTISVMAQALLVEHPGTGYSLNLDLSSCHGRCIFMFFSQLVPVAFLVETLVGCTLAILYIQCFESLIDQDIFFILNDVPSDGITS